MLFNNRIREIREARGLSLTALAKKADNADGPTLSLIERGKRDLRLSWMRRIAPHLDVKPGDLLAEEDVQFHLTGDEGWVVRVMRGLDQVVRDQLIAVIDGGFASFQMPADEADHDEDTDRPVASP